MSYTELYGFTKTGVESIGETRNAWRGAMAVWTFLEKKYLPKYRPSWARDDKMDYSRTCSGIGSKDDIKEIWDLFRSKKISDSERIVMGSTYDNVLVKVEDIEKVLKAFREFEGETSLKEQADIIEEALKELPDIIAIGWNQTSVNGDTWTNTGGHDEVSGESVPYNLETGAKHWFLIETIEREDFFDRPVNKDEISE